MTGKSKLRELIPWYLNGTLLEKERLEVEQYIQSDPDGRRELVEWLRVRNFVQDRPAESPAESIEEKIFARIKSNSSSQISLFHPYALGLSFIILILLWTVLRPGVVLRWTISGTEVSSFRIFRADAISNEYRLLDQIPAEPSTSDYAYVDLFFWPFLDYNYYVEGMNQAESLGMSQIVTGNALLALPGQLALICASIFLGYGTILLIRNRRSNFFDRPR